MQLDYKRLETLQQVKMVRAQNHQIVEAYKAIQATVADIAKKRGFDLVLVNNDAEVPDNAGDIANQETVANLVFGRNVLYTSEKINITAEVVTAVDAGLSTPPTAK
jgi:Skp family chaperone for outer membrane proteins